MAKKILFSGILRTSETKNVENDWEKKDLLSEPRSTHQEDKKKELTPFQRVKLGAEEVFLAKEAIPAGFCTN
ncbi:MAG TPA: hypothetical protein VGB30_05930 [bacterium]|jgi:hypothetical protein